MGLGPGYFGASWAIDKGPLQGLGWGFGFFFKSMRVMRDGDRVVGELWLPCLTRTIKSAPRPAILSPLILRIIRRTLMDVGVVFGLSRRRPRNTFWPNP